MRRLTLRSEIEREIDTSVSEVDALLADIPRAVQLLPLVSLVRAEGSRYRVHLGPFGVAGVRGTVRLLLEREQKTDPDAHELTLRSVPGEGNTDATIAFSARRASSPDAGVIVRCALEATPRKDIPALVPLSLVQRAAERVVAAGLRDGLDAFAETLTHATPMRPDLAPQ